MLISIETLFHRVNADAMKSNSGTFPTVRLTLMSGTCSTENMFGALAVEMNFVDKASVDKALVVQERIFEKTQVNMPIGSILVEMKALTDEQCNEILQMQRELSEKPKQRNPSKRSDKKGSPKRSIQKEGSSLDINISKDKLKATIYIEGQVPAAKFDVSDVKLMLHSEGICHGIASDDLIKAFLNGEFGVGEDWTVAAGTAPTPDTPPEIIYHFDTDPLKIGTMTEDGLMDWKDRGTLPQVREGDLLAEKKPGPSGKPGMDVFGQKIPIPKIREQRLKHGRGARRSSDDMQVHASIAGIPKRTITGEISVMPVLNIQGNISLETGHVSFEGHIEVSGTVEKGYRVKGGSLRANEIADAHIEVDGDIMVANGIYGATIRCDGNLKAGHIHNADIRLAGDVVTEKEILESTIEANGRCLINDGTIVSSTVSAKMGITAMDIGTEASKPIELTVGIDQPLTREADIAKTELQAISTERESLPKRIVDLKNRLDQINTQLGEVAQKQDRCMVQQRTLQEKIEAGVLKQAGHAGEKIQQTIAELAAKQKSYDQDVARLMETDDDLSKALRDAQDTLAAHDEKYARLNSRLDIINETRKTRPGKAVVKIAGSVISGTKVTGPHAMLVMEDELKRLAVVEVQKPDHDGVKRWRFEYQSIR
jgi:uncharacterized protein (DUF342 family)